MSIMISWELFELAFVCRWSKNIFLKARMKENIVLPTLILGFLFWHNFVPRKNISYFRCIAFRRGLTIAIPDLALYLRSEEFNISLSYPCIVYNCNITCNIVFKLSLTGSHFILPKSDESIWDLGGKLT